MSSAEATHTPTSARMARHDGRTASIAPKEGATPVELPHHPALAAHDIVQFLARRAVAGVESVTDGAYSRSLRLPHGAGALTLTPHAKAVTVELDVDDPRDESAAREAAPRILRLDVAPDAVH